MQKLRSNSLFNPPPTVAPWCKTSLPPPRSMNNRGIPYVWACKTRSPTVGLRKLGRPKGCPRASEVRVGLSRTRQTVHRALPHFRATNTQWEMEQHKQACSISNYTVHLPFRVWPCSDLLCVCVCVFFVCMLCCRFTNLCSIFQLIVVVLVLAT